MLPPTCGYYSDDVLPPTCGYYSDDVLPPTCGYYSDDVLPPTCGYYSDDVLPPTCGYYSDDVLPPTCDYYSDDVLSSHMWLLLQGLRQGDSAEPPFIFQTLKFVPTNNSSFKVACLTLVHLAQNKRKSAPSTLGVVFF